MGQADRVAPVVALTSPSADAVCPSATDACTGAVINAASGGQFSFQGSLSEGGGVASVTLTAEVWNPATNQMVVRLSPAPTAAASWTGTWSGIGSYNGLGLSLRVFATDAAGNASALATRGLWVDNVAPTVTLPVNGARLVSRQATLLIFSEPVQAGSVRAAMSFTPAVALPGTFAGDITATAWGFGGALTLRGPAFVAWASKAGMYGQVTAHAACSATPTAASPNWMAGVLNTVQVGGITSIPAAIRTSAALGSTLFAVAVESGSTISVLSAPANGGCTAVPTVSLVGTITGGQDPAVAIDAAGKVWVAYIETATGNLLLRVF